MVKNSRLGEAQPAHDAAPNPTQEVASPKRITKVTPSGLSKPESVKEREATGETQPAHDLVGAVNTLKL